MKRIIQKNQFVILLAIYTILLIIPSTNVIAAERKDVWYAKKGYYYYFDNAGKKLKGLQSIGKKSYLFNNSGIQLTGWQKIGKKFYFFRNADGKKGYMVKNSTVNGIKLTSSGVAKVSDPAAKRKVKLMCDYNQWVQEITKKTQTKEQKLKTCFDYLRGSMRYRFVSKMRRNDPYWYIWAAEKAYKNPRIDCYPISAAFAFMANAIGYTDIYVCSSGIHGWTEINGKYYDPSLSRANLKSYRMYAATLSQSYRSVRYYVADLRQLSATVDKTKGRNY